MTGSSLFPSFGISTYVRLEGRTPRDTNLILSYLLELLVLTFVLSQISTVLVVRQLLFFHKSREQYT